MLCADSIEGASSAASATARSVEASRVGLAFPPFFKGVDAMWRGLTLRRATPLRQQLCLCSVPGLCGSMIGTSSGTGVLRVRESSSAVSLCVRVQLR
jgi:hypothetical protein